MFFLVNTIIISILIHTIENVKNLNAICNIPVLKNDFSKYHSYNVVKFPIVY